MKKKVLLTSVLTIALCLSLIAGSTFALFTSESGVNIAVTAGEVKVIAKVGKLQLSSMDVDMSGTTFANGGTAEYDEAKNKLTLDKVTPGDKVEFPIEITNYSNVAIKYRLSWYIEGELKNVLVAKADDTVIKNGASDWTPWAPVANTEEGETKTVKVSVELPAEVNNVYQEKEADIYFKVEAVQGNGTEKYQVNVSDPSALNAAIAAGGNVVLDGSITPDSSLTVAEDTEVFIDINENSINGSVINQGGEVAIQNGTIEVEAAGFENYGTGTLTDVDMKAGTPDDYAGITNGEDAKTTFENVNLTSGGGGIGAVGGAEVVFSSGSVAVNSASTSGRYIFYAAGAGTVITIEGGEFSFSKTLNQKRAYIYAGAGTTVYVKGGTFGPASTRSGYTAGILGTGDVIITGGTFGFDPTAWVADGYEAVNDGTNWVVSAK